MSGVSLYDGPDMKLFILIGWAAGASCLLLGPPRFNWCFPFAPGFSKFFGAQGSLTSGSILNVLSPRFLFIRVVIMIYLFVLHDPLTS